MAVEEQRWREGIAIVGMGARFPGCRSVGEYWEKIAAGVSLLSAPSGEELRAAGLDPGLAEPAMAEAMHFVRSGTTLEDAESFDTKFFEMSRREAEMTDPQQRILLECAYEALENAGMTGDGARVGVFAGVGMNTYMMQLLGNPEMLAAAGGYQLMLGNDKDFLASHSAPARQRRPNLDLRLHPLSPTREHHRRPTREREAKKPHSRLCDGHLSSEFRGRHGGRQEVPFQ